MFVLVLGFTFHTNASQPLSISGCDCKSGCSSSWLRSNSNPWCYVDSACNVAGWDSCRDTQTLYRSAVNEKAEAEQQRLEEKLKREDAEKNGEALKGQLAQTNARLEEAQSKATSLKQQLVEEFAKEAK